LIERMRIGSRPSRRGNAGLFSLRAIPWVFSWAQTRSSLSAWYGVGTGFAAGIAEFGLPAMQEMTRDWAFFDTLVDDIEMVLAKADMEIAELYSQLAGNELHQHFFPTIRAEFERCQTTVLQLKQADSLLSQDPRLANSIRLRNPYIDPLSVLQVDLLKAWRAAGSPEDQQFKILLSTINGISQGLQNTG
jgi:phosphoenolpyruvate carboxylase